MVEQAVHPLFGCRAGILLLGLVQFLNDPANGRPMGTVTSFNLDANLTPAGDIACMFAALSAKFWEQPHIPAEQIELCRLALAVMHKAAAEQGERHPAAKALPQAKIDGVLGERWRGSDLFSPGEKALLNF